MRDAFGGVFMIRLMLVFIVIYVAFGALSLNYAKAFKIKNKVISYIEENNIQNFCNEEELSNLGRMLDQYHSIVECDSSKYNTSTPCAYDIKSDITTTYCYHGVRIEELENLNNETKNISITNYKVSTFASWNLNFMNKILMLSGRSPHAGDVINGSWEITGKAKVIKRNSSDTIQTNSYTNIESSTPIIDEEEVPKKRKYNNDPSIIEYTWEAYGDQELLKSLKNTCKYKYNGEYVDHDYVYKKNDSKGNPVWDLYLYCK